MMKHLPPLFTWNDWLDWAEATSPDAPLSDVQRLFDECAAHGVIKPYEINDDGEFVYELVPKVVRIAVIEAAYLGQPNVTYNTREDK